MLLDVSRGKCMLSAVSRGKCMLSVVCRCTFSSILLSLYRISLSCSPYILILYNSVIVVCCSCRTRRKGCQDPGPVPAAFIEDYGGSEV